MSVYLIRDGMASLFSPLVPMAWVGRY